MLQIYKNIFIEILLYIRNLLLIKFKDYVFASACGSDVRRKLGRSIAFSVGPSAENGTHMRASIFLVSRSRLHHVLLVCTVISDPAAGTRKTSSEETPHGCSGETEQMKFHN